MSESYRILQSDWDEIRKERRRTWFLIFTASLISLSLFLYPVLKEYRYRWDAMKASRLLANYLVEIKTQAMNQRQALEVKFVEPDILEVYEVSSCSHNSKKERIFEKTLSELVSNVYFVPEAAVRSIVETKEPVLNRFCYDPLFGSSLHADGIRYGSVYLAHLEVLKEFKTHAKDKNDLENLISELPIESINGDFF